MDNPKASHPLPKGMNHARTVAASLLLLALIAALSFASANAEVPKFDSGKAFAFLLKQCEIGPRNPGSQGHLKGRDYLVATLSQYADKVTTQPFPLRFGQPEQTVETYNIIARFQPEKKERILLCAHWDTRPWADDDPDPEKHNTPIIGANDGASGVAVLLEVARLLHDHKAPVGVDIVLFDGEDAGTSGSMNSWAQGAQYFARNLASKDRPVFGVLIDMIGDADLAILKESNSMAAARPVVEKVWKIAQDLGCTAFKPELGSSIMDDHIPLLQVGIPVIDLIDLDYPYWHTVADTPDKCSAASLDQVGRVLIHLIYTY
ncbi:MAG: M28 family peptidase [Candidatus Aminicenantaceae bacterium]